MSGPDLAIVILNWKGLNDTIACVESVRRCTPSEDTYVVVVDNGGHDAANLADMSARLRVDLIVLPHNLGFSRGYNVGIRQALSAGASVVGVLNNDTVVEPGFLEPLVRELNMSKCALAVSPTIVYHDDPGRIWFAGSRYDASVGMSVHDAHSSGYHESPDYLSGCAIFAKSYTWLHVGLFSERFFLNFEDVEWSYRARAAGVTLTVVADSVVEHRVSASAGKISALSSYLYSRNGIFMAHERLRMGRSSDARAFAVNGVLRPLARRVWRRESGSARAAGLAVLGIGHGLLGRPSGAPGAWVQKLAGVDIGTEPRSAFRLFDELRRSAGSSEPGSRVDGDAAL